MTEKYEFIDGEAGNFPVQQTCTWAGVSTSGFYHWRSRPLSATAKRRAELRAVILQVFSDSQETYGYRRVHAALRWLTLVRLEAVSADGKSSVRRRGCDGGAAPGVRPRSHGRARTPRSGRAEPCGTYRAWPAPARRTSSVLLVTPSVRPTRSSMPVTSCGVSSRAWAT